MGWVAIAAQVAGTVISAIGAYQQGQAQKGQNEYQAAVARNNQILAEQYAKSAEQRGNVMAQQKQMELARRQGSIKAAIGASGLDVGGSGSRLEDDTQMMGDLDVRTIRYNAAKEAYGFRTQGTTYAGQAQLDDAAAANAASGGNLGALGSIISGGAQVSDKWARYKQAGVSTDWFS